MQSSPAYNDVRKSFLIGVVKDMAHYRVKRYHPIERLQKPVRFSRALCDFGGTCCGEKRSRKAENVG